MPILTMVVRPIISMFRGWGAPSVAVRQKANRGQLTTKALSTNDYVAEEATLDFGPLARHIGIAPFMPMAARAANALLGALPIIRDGLGELFHGRLNVAVLDAAALIVSLLRRDFKTASLLVLLLGMGEMLENYARKKSMASFIQALKGRGKRVIMLTGDDERTARAVAQKLDIDAYRAQVLPADKADVVMRLKDQGAKVLMVGDGINDSPALSAADVGVTLRDGTDIAQEVADVVLAPSLDNLLTALDLGEATLKRIRSNMYWSVGLNTGFLAGGLTGLITPAVSALMHNSKSCQIYS